MLRRQYTIEYKLDTYVKIARLYLEDDDAVNAEAFINRASHLQADTKDEKLQIYYKVRVPYKVRAVPPLPSYWSITLQAQNICRNLILWRENSSKLNVEIMSKT